MNRLARLIGFTILSILLAGGLLTSVFAHSIEAALTLPSNSSVTPVIPPTATTSPTTKPNTGTTPGATATPVATNILAQDTFQRADQPFWGTASDGQPWGSDAANKNVFSISAKTGQVANGQGAFNATLGPAITDAEVQFSASISQFNQSNFGALLRWTDANDWYKAYVDGTSLVLLKRAAGMTTRLNSIPFTARAGSSYTLLFRVVGTTLAAKVWQTGNVEPANWMVTVTDNTLQSGYAGLRLVLENGIVAKFTSFQETTAV
jgi:hypothetical protein